MPVLEVSPKVVSFTSISTDTTYTQCVTLKNVSSSCIKLRFRRPSTSFFQFSPPKSYTLAPGISTSLTITFSCTKLSPYYDSFIILLSNHPPLSVSLEAIPPKPSLSFSHKLIDFIRIPSFSKSSLPLCVTNSSQTSANISFVVNASLPNLQVSPSSVHLLPASSSTVSVNLTTQDPGAFSSYIQAMSMDEHQKVPINEQLIEVRAIVFGETLSLYDLRNLDHVVKSINFDCSQMFFGKSVVKEYCLWNNSGGSVKFNFSKNFTPGLSKHDEFLSDTFLQVTPRVGTITTEDQNVKLSISFTPKLSSQNLLKLSRLIMTKQFKSLPITPFKLEYTLTLTSTTLGETKATQFNFEGSAVVPLIAIDQYELYFDSTVINHSSTKTISVSNLTGHDLVVSFGKIAHFNVTSPQIQILKNSQISIPVVFCPKQGGELTGSIPVFVGVSQESTFQLHPLSVFGKCDLHSSITSKTPIIPDTRDSFKLSTIKKPLFKTDPTIIDPLNPNQLPLEEMEGNHVHRMGYIKHMRSQRVKQELRMTRELRKQYENDVDLGMIPGDEINPPSLSCLPLTEKIVLQKSRQSVASTSLLTSADSFVTKKFPSPSKTELGKLHALSDCDLELISAGVTEIDFGKLAIGSKVAKSFNIHNGTAQSIAIKVDLAQFPLLSCSKTQLIPPNSTAGFDIILNIDKTLPNILNMVGNFTASPSVSINNQSILNLELFAEITEILLQPVNDILAFEWSNSSNMFLNPAYQELVLTNTSNSTAFFSLKECPSWCILFCPQDSIAPFKTARLKVELRPDSRVSYSGSIKFKVDFGPMVKVDVIGTIVEGRITSTVKK
ncbi:hypothetical protein GEMRC1_003666 [Eukaryota sp. GEM-RC1]